jgi:hypothetical protein
MFHRYMLPLFRMGNTKTLKIEAECTFEASASQVREPKNTTDIKKLKSATSINRCARPQYP